MNRKTVYSSCIGVLIVITSVIIHRIYYGDWLPNTLYLKSFGGAKSISGGIQYFASSLWNDGLLPLYIFFIIGLLYYFSRNRRKTVIFALIIIVWILYIAWTGGDAFPHSRFLLPIIPLTIIIAANGMAKIWEIISSKCVRTKGKISFSNGLFVFIFCAVIMVSFFWTAVSPNEYLYPDENRIDRVAVAEALEKNRIPSDALIALFEAGTIPFLLPQFRYHDLLGKNDRRIAQTQAHAGLVGHNKWDFDYSLGIVKPDIIITRDNYGGMTDEIARALLAVSDNSRHDKVFFPIALWLHPVFVNCYRNNRVFLETPFGSHWVFARNIDA